MTSSLFVPLALLLFALAAWYWRRDARSIRAAYYFVVIFVLIFVVLGGVAGFASALGTAVVNPGGDCPDTEPASALLPQAPPAQQPPVQPPVQQPPVITLPPVASFPPLPTVAPEPLPTIEIPDFTLPPDFPVFSPVPGASPGFNIPPLRGGAAAACGRSAAIPPALQSLLTIGAAGALLLFHADRARKSLAEEA